MAFNELVAAHGDRVFNTVLGMLQHQEDAEDVTQEVFVAVYQNIQKFRGDAKLSTWIYRIAITKALESLRRNKQRRSKLVDEGLAKLESTPAAPFNHPGIAIENKEKAAVLFKALAQLPDNQKTAFVLHKTEGLSYAEVAAVMNLSIPSIESLIYRARQNLQRILASFYEKDKD